MSAGNSFQIRLINIQIISAAWWALVIVLIALLSGYPLRDVRTNGHRAVAPPEPRQQEEVGNQNLGETTAAQAAGESAERLRNPEHG